MIGERAKGPRNLQNEGAKQKMCVCETLDPISKLTRDLKESAKLLSPTEARYLVDAYYTIQDYRKASASQVRELTKSAEPCELISWLQTQMETLEGQIKRALDSWTDSKELGKWAKSIVGVGPVITAGLLAHIDIVKAPSAGHIFSFAGLNPTREWRKGEKRPWNASLKTLCWKIGESFVKVSGNEKDFYGKLYLKRKVEEIEKNERLEFKEQAVAMLQKKEFDKDTVAYANYIIGKLPPAQIHARAKRWAVKIFLSHYHHVAYKLHFGIDPPLPYPHAHLGHVDLIKPPNFD
jgi:hypothetical protein